MDLANSTCWCQPNTQDRQGRLVTCEHGSRRVRRTEHDGSITVIVDRYDGKPLNSPNDVVVKSDGSVWFSDPPFGIAGNYEGNAATPELPQSVYRVDGETGQASVVASDLRGPNGLCFSPDETKLYVVESRATPNRLIRVFDVINGRKLVNDRVFVDAGPGTPDGLHENPVSRKARIEHFDGRIGISLGWLPARRSLFFGPVLLRRGHVQITPGLRLCYQV